MISKGAQEAVQQAVQGYTLLLKYPNAAHHTNTDADPHPGSDSAWLVPDAQLVTFLNTSRLLILRVIFPELPSGTVAGEP